MITAVRLAQPKTYQSDLRKTQHKAVNHDKSDISFGINAKINPWVAGYITEAAVITAGACGVGSGIVNKGMIGAGLVALLVTCFANYRTYSNNLMRNLNLIGRDF